ncbi:thiamine pyrophosphate-dependent dehydrogenase E1 component subunit alpha [Jannaschia aquimarina]|uniref:AcoA_3 protein n=1 Tax=Jannaschia aquimarina TaxID=935700 RepID=A0A0D1EGE7_9RHOB|nr:thiamine pyrophosphate-dependent dehydrogenase E1 component subunit alpha [Jannaschia aquimarina]KIT14920.1 Acetoin:2,6-dichlorophenolindophenol oxidoreductase subunit alpha [Jannaschia aquimarina]SNS59361.1 pyruvate dehydrogenase E1 component alpha subunit [Jannaschia aquimarina]
MSRANDAHIARYRTMRRIRTFEERVGELFLKGESAGSMLHLSIGEEAVVGLTDHMRDGDTFTTHHRGHGIFLARGADPARMLAEIGGRGSGYCRGKGGSMHIADRGLGHLGANAIVGGGIPHVVGAGISARNAGSDAVSVAFFGDGAMSQGILYEAKNMAALWKLPVVFCCINNQYGMGTRVDRSAGHRDFPARATAFGLNGARADGAEVEEVFEAAQDVMDGARNGRAGFLEIDAYRFHGHARMDKSPYRSPEEEEEGRQRDPLARARNRIGDDITLDRIDDEAEAEMDKAMEDAIAAAPPDHASMFEDVYAEGTPPPRPQRERLMDILGESA